MDFRSFLPERSFEDIIGERVRLTVGGEEYILPVKTLDDNQAWRATLETDFQVLMSSLAESKQDTSKIVALLTRDPDWLLDHLISYDHTSVLPDKAALRQALTPIKLLMCVIEVWRVANPLVDIALASLSPASLKFALSDSSPPTDTSLPSLAGQPVASGAN